MSLHDYTVVCSIHTSEHSVNIWKKSAFEKLNKCHFTSRHVTSPLDYHVVCSIHNSETSENSAFGKNRPSDNFRFRTYAILHCLNQIRIFYNFMVKTCVHHDICDHQIHKEIFQNILLSAQWIVILAKMIVACSLERR